MQKQFVKPKIGSANQLSLYLAIVATIFPFGGCGKWPQSGQDALLEAAGFHAGNLSESVEVQSISPAAGIQDGNVFVMISGKGFQPGTEVLFGEQPAKNLQVLSTNLLTMTTPELPLGRTDITIQSPQMERTILADAYETISTFCMDDADDDGDGLTNCEEKLGHYILVDYFGYGLNNETSQLQSYIVTSNPQIADTDRDGLTDLEESRSRSNPRLKDTDNDGLDDWEEVHRWITSPSSVDSDGDARGPTGDLPPDASLFDGNELNTIGFTQIEYLYFSEYVEGSEDESHKNRALEIYNGTGETINFGTNVGELPYGIVIAYNDVLAIIPLQGSVANEDGFVIADPSTDASVLQIADQVTALNFEGNNVITLELNGMVVDSFGSTQPLEFVDPVIDQINPEGTNPVRVSINEGESRWQSFTAGYQSQLQRLYIKLINTSNVKQGLRTEFVPGHITVALYSGTGIDDLYEIVSLPFELPTEFDEILDVDVPINLIDGLQYTWAVQVEEGSVDLFEGSNDYLGGVNDNSGEPGENKSYVFSTEVATPKKQWGENETATRNHTLRRNPGVCGGDTIVNDVFLPEVEWIGYPIDQFDDLGQHYANCPQRIVQGGTSPSLEDTDGDGRTDYEEGDDPIHHPLIADVPKLGLEVVDAVDIRLDVEYAETNEHSREYGTEFSTSTSTTNSSYSSASVNASLTLGSEATIGLEPSVSFSQEITIGAEASWGTTNESSRSAEQAYSEYLTDTQSLTETVSEGSMTMGIQLSNQGDISFRITELGITVRHWKPGGNDLDQADPGVFRTFATLKPALEGGITLASGATSPVLQVAAENLNAQRVKEFLAWPNRLYLEPAFFELENAQGFNFAFLEEVTGARTATIIIDKGLGEPEEYRVATNVNRNVDSSYAGVRLGYVMSGLLQIPFETMPRQDVNMPNDTSTTNENVLVKVRDAGTEVDGVTTRFWFVRMNSSLPPPPDVDFEDITVHHGDEILIIYSRDDDGDGLYAAEEEHYGTLDNSTDSDGDGLSDPVEVRTQYYDETDTLVDGGWEVQVTDEPSYRVFSNPGNADADKDGWNDFEEMSNGTDPNNKDTDNDGLIDRDDLLPLDKADIIYVKSDATGSNTGDSWQDAITDLALAIATATQRNVLLGDNDDVSEIWVARGTYSTPLSSSFSLAKNVSMLGGFSGQENKRNQRDSNPLTNETILQYGGGELGPIIGVSGPGYTPSTLLDGFLLDGGTGAIRGMKISNGANITASNCAFVNFSVSGSVGAALHIENSDSTFNKCQFSQNTNTEGELGGAVYLLRSNVRFVDCNFTGNQVNASSGATGQGGAIYGAFCPSLEFIGCRFSNNSVNNPNSAPSGHGGAVSLGRCNNSIFRKCQFTSNYVEGLDVMSSIFTIDYTGGGLSIDGPREFGGITKHTLINCQFSRNSAPHFGGGLYVGPDSDVSVINSTFSRNAVIDDGTIPPLVCLGNLVYAPHTNVTVGAAIGSYGTTRVENSIIWDNDVTSKIISYGSMAEYVEYQVSPGPHFGCVQGGSGTVIVENSCMENLNTIFPGTFLGIGNILQDPGFVNGFRLSSTSPAIDAGNSFVDANNIEFGHQPLPVFDIIGNQRITDGDGNGFEDVDMGAYEYQPEQ